MDTYQINSKNLKLAEKISKLVRGQIEPDQYPLDDVNIMSLLTSIHSRLTGEIEMFPSTYLAAKQIIYDIEHNPPSLEELKFVYEVLYGHKPDEGLTPEEITEQIVIAIRELQRAAAGHRYNADLDSLAEGTNEGLGDLSQANGVRSHTEGVGTIAIGTNQHVEGRFNIPDNSSLHIVGNGVDENHRSNAEKLSYDGKLWVASDVETGTGHKLSEKLTSEQTQALVNDSIKFVGSLTMEAVTELPSNGINYRIYFLYNEETDKYDEWMWINARWQKVGDTDLDLSGFIEQVVTTADIYQNQIASQRAIEGLRIILDDHKHNGRIHTSVEQEVHGEVLTFNWNQT